MGCCLVVQVSDNVFKFKFLTIFNWLSKSISSNWRIEFWPSKYMLRFSNCFEPKMIALKLEYKKLCFPTKFQDSKIHSLFFIHPKGKFLKYKSIFFSAYDGSEQWNLLLEKVSTDLASSQSWFPVNWEIFSPKPTMICKVWVAVWSYTLVTMFSNSSF